MIPQLWSSSHGFLHRNRLRREAAAQAATHALPIAPRELEKRLHLLRETLVEKLHLAVDDHPLDVQFHGDVICDGYKVRRISYASARGIRVTGNLYVPDGPGPFPAVLNLHGHWLQGKIAPRVQARGHLLALNGMVVLTVDAAGSGERAEEERTWTYHGGRKAADLLLSGDSLLGLQIRDNRRAIDVLQSLSCVDVEKIGVTGASGGGNQSMWLAAMEERIKAVVLAVSVGSFEAYVCSHNCLCETLPGGLAMTEEWGVLGLIAPRPLLVINALHDQPAFGYEAMSVTCRQVEEIYLLKGARECFDTRLIDMQHGYHPPALHAMLGWMRHWLGNVPGPAGALPDWHPIPEEDLLCYPPGERPEMCGYPATRQVLHQMRPRETHENPEQARLRLAELTGWKAPTETDGWKLKRVLPDGTRVGAVVSSRGVPLPVVVSGDWDGSNAEIRVILSPHGKGSPFVSAQWQAARAEGFLAVTADFPGVGELEWESTGGDIRFHESSRACLWLGYTLLAEWAEAVALLCITLKELAPHARIHCFAEEEMVFAALLCRALHPGIRFTLTESGAPASLEEAGCASMVWCVPGFLPWGDLDLLRALAQSGGETGK